jgi:aspartate dehydrogenase
VSGAALADDRVRRELDAAGQSSGHRLRLVAGALAALDGVAMTSVDPQVRLRLELDLPGAGQAGTLFSGTARQAALRFPDGVNVAVAAALAGPGLDQTEVVVTRPLAGHCLSLRAISRHAQVEAAVEIRSGGLHPVAACLIALLRRETQTIWVG